MIKEKFAEQVPVWLGDELLWTSCIPWDGAPTTVPEEAIQKFVDTFIYTETIGLLSYC